MLKKVIVPGIFNNIIGDLSSGGVIGIVCRVDGAKDR